MPTCGRSRRSCGFPIKAKSGLPLQAVLLDGLDKQLGRLEWRARRTLRDALANVTCDLERVFGRNPPATVASQVLIPFKLERSLASAMAVLPQKEAKAFDLDGL